MVSILTVRHLAWQTGAPNNKLHLASYIRNSQNPYFLMPRQAS
jgi:hypothetical protein